MLGQEDLAKQDGAKALILDPTAILAVFPFPLPAELVVYVFSFLTRRERALCAMTCKLWNQLVALNFSLATRGDQWKRQSSICDFSNEDWSGYNEDFEQEASYGDINEAD